MAVEVTMPKLGLTMTDGTVESWAKKEGDAVAIGDILFEVSTDKLTNEIEARNEGVLLKIVVPAGGTVDVHTVVAVIGEAGEDVSMY